MTAYEAASDAILTAHQHDMRTLARDLVARLGQEFGGPAAEGPGAVTAWGWDTLGELGWAGLAVDEADGGLGLGMAERCIVAEEIGRGLIHLPFLSVTLAADVLRLLCREDLARPRQRRIAEAEDKTAVVAGTRLLAPALDHVAVSAVQAHDGTWTLDGSSSLVPEATGATDLLVVAAVGDGGTGVFGVKSSAPGLEFSPVRTLDLRRDFASIAFNSVVAERLDAGRADQAAMRHVEYRAELTLAAEAVGGALACLERTIDHVCARHQFGSPIGSFQAVKHRLARAWVAIESARELVLAAAAAVDDRTALQEQLAIAARIAASSALRLAADEAIQFHGGMGFTWELGVHHYFRRSFVADQILSTASERSSRLASTLGV